MHDSVRAVLRDPAFRRSLQRTLADRFLMWMGEWFGRFVRVMRHLPPMRYVGFTVVALIVLFVLVRMLIASRTPDEQGIRHVRRRRDASTQDDPWRVADSLADSGRLEEAAHALYRAVLLTIASTDRIRLDPSRTSGDYARELRRRGSPAVTRFRMFTRRFESAVYGHERCTSDVFAELLKLSEPFRPRARAA